MFCAGADCPGVGNKRGQCEAAIRRRTPDPAAIDARNGLIEIELGNRRRIRVDAQVDPDAQARVLEWIVSVPTRTAKTETASALNARRWGRFLAQCRLSADLAEWRGQWVRTFTALFPATVTRILTDQNVHGDSEPVKAPET
jgi:hypothetical protein